jgi:L-fuculose-phosphate aldolase
MIRIRPNINAALPSWYDLDLCSDFLLYGQRLTDRQLVVNTFGNIALRATHCLSKRELIYTKHRGISLEECKSSNIVALDLLTDELLFGEDTPSQGHQMHREIMCHRPEIFATIHLHPNDVISYFTVMQQDGMKYISNDTALVLGKAPHILDSKHNLELDTSIISTFIADTNCIVMPNHGITVLGRTLSEAYHRAVAFSAEITRVMKCLLLAASTGRSPSYIIQPEIDYMYKNGDRIIYGQ